MINLHEDMEMAFRHWSELPITHTVYKAFKRMRENYVSSAIVESTNSSLSSEQLRNRLAYAKGVDDVLKVMMDSKKVAELTK